MKQANSTGSASAKAEQSTMPNIDEVFGDVSIDDVMHARLVTRELIGGPKSPKGTLAKCALRFRDVCSKLSSGITCDRDEIETTVLSLKREIVLLNLEMRKLKMVEMAMDADLLEYKDLQSQIETSQEKNKLETMDLQQTLVKEKLVRRDKQEYEALAKIANNLPSKRETTTKLDAVRSELNNLKGQEGQRDRELDIREKQFQLLLQCIFDLKSTLEEDDDKPNQGGDDDLPEVSSSVEEKSNQLQSMITDP